MFAETHRVEVVNVEFRYGEGIQYLVRFVDDMEDDDPDFYNKQLDGAADVAVRLGDLYYTESDAKAVMALHALQLLFEQLRNSIDYTLKTGEDLK